MQQSFAERLCKQIALKKSHAVIGLDPVIDKLPSVLVQKAIDAYGKTSEGAAHAFLLFNKLIIDAVSDLAAIVKPQLAYYEVFGAPGIEAYWRTVEYAHSQGMLVIADAKRGDISSTADAYAQAFFSKSSPWKSPDQWVDSLTINPYLGSDSLLPFIESANTHAAGTFILLKTSNPSAGDLQDLRLDNGLKMTDKVSQFILSLQETEKTTHAYSSVGAVVGASYPEDLAYFRKKLPRSIFLVPGYGTQGNFSANLSHAFNEDGYGALISASRSINYAFGTQIHADEGTISDMIRKAALTMNEDINHNLTLSNKLAW
ncbi:orotidine-5'-phosphate decarboxylase [Paenibacillus athensensis]|uniref:Orotidine 5'-phosphate decarboxylase n=1 Tax=Paenibacillus athensensis TaxID=1967502 RepID=A0A4Y8QB23_9BACL|nr:orotidine-5'-phosphate decarboxylase [Paenibacillus athensensis]